VRVKTLVYFSFLGAALLLFGLGALLTPHVDGDGAGLGLLRFLVLLVAAGSAIGTWGTAVTIASIHKRTWPLYLAVAMVLLASVVFATTCYRTPPVRG
jgi:hypothetical protein